MTHHYGASSWPLVSADRHAFFAQLLDSETQGSKLQVTSGAEGLGLALQQAVLPGEEIYRCKALKVHRHSAECEKVEAICKAGRSENKLQP